MFSFSYKFKLFITSKNVVQSSVYLQIIINRKPKRYFFKIFANPHQWNEKKQRINGKTKSIIENNLLLDQYESKIQAIILNFKLQNSDITHEQFENLFFQIQNKTSFFDYANSFLKRNSAKYSKETIRTYKSQISKLKRFNSEIDIKDINLRFLESYLNHQLQNGYAKNTAYKSTAFIKIIINQAIKENLIKENPFKYFKIKYQDGTRPFLTKNEVEKIHIFFSNTENKKLKNVARYFLFSCYTGLRYSDVKELSKENIINNTIYIKVHKTNENLSIPLNKKAISYIPEENKSLYLFSVLSNQKTNEYLKIIASECDIKKVLSFHVARHTFATLAIGLDIPIEVISKILGHRDIKTTQIYSKIVEDVKRKHLNKFDNM